MTARLHQIIITEVTKQFAMSSVLTLLVIVCVSSVALGATSPFWPQPAMFSLGSAELMLSQEFAFGDSKLHENAIETARAVFENADQAKRFLELPIRYFRYVVEALFPANKQNLNDVFDVLGNSDQNLSQLVAKSSLLSESGNKAWSNWLCDIVRYNKECDSDGAVLQKLLDTTNAIPLGMATTLKAENTEQVVKAEQNSGTTTTGENPGGTKKSNSANDAVFLSEALTVPTEAKDATTSQIRLFMSSLETFLLEQCLPGQNGLWCDCGYSKVEKKDDWSLAVEQMPRLLVFNYFGSLSLAPVEGGFHICDALGKSFYLDPRNAFHVPAFYIKQFRGALQFATSDVNVVRDTRGARLPRQAVFAGGVPRWLHIVVFKIGLVGHLVEREFVHPAEVDESTRHPEGWRDEIGLDPFASAEQRLNFGKVLVVVVV